MKHFLFILVVMLGLVGCKSHKIVTKKSGTTKKSAKTRTAEPTETNYRAANIVKEAKKFEGVRYKLGGDTKKGMDCSGLIHTAFKTQGIVLPRTTKDLSVTGDWIDLKTVKKGDLLFFATRKNSRKVNHVGIVTASKVGRVEFIHSTTSKGVITSNLSERYWYFAFVQARRVL